MTAEAKSNIVAAKCPNCGVENPAGSRFCNRCGASLTPQPSAIDKLVEEYRRKLDSEPENAMVRYNLGLAYEYKGEDDLAVLELEKVREQCPDFADVEYHLASLYHKTGQKARAQQAARRALELEPSHEEARVLLDLLEKE
jgi:tetratricopeptide (TPR) repeat protein